MKTEHSTIPFARRSAGILLHVSSLPGRYGIGDLGPGASAWVDALARAKQSWWQVLPLGPPGAGDSPYQSFSAFAGDPNLISPEALAKDRLLRRPELTALEAPAGPVRFKHVGRKKAAMLETAWARFKEGAARSLRRPFESFCDRHAHWLEDFALFTALRESRPHARSWTDWPAPLVRREAKSLAEARTALADSVEKHQFVQFLFFRQLDSLRAYAAERGVKLIGDLPIYVSPESADVWANPHLFLLDRHRRPTAVAGVPPDAFSRTGQRWGNPLYNWPALRREGFAWWVARARAVLAQVDIVRIDHFRGFAAYWKVPASQPTAVVGRWVKAPGAELLQAFRRELGGLPFIAEDLGVITPDVEAMRDEAGLPGMRVLQFGFGGDAGNPHLPHNYVPNSVVYTGTHDNDTTAGWFRSLNKAQRAHLARYYPGAQEDPAWSLIRLAWSSPTVCAIAPAQDLLRLGSRARFNRPGTATGNWSWRLTEPVPRKILDELAELTSTFGR